MLNRYCWEQDVTKHAGLRMRAGLHFYGVLKVQAQNLRQDAPGMVLELLAVAFTPGSEGAGSIALSFAGGGSIKLDVECIDAAMSDLAGPWPAAARPRHRLGRDVEQA